jgi:hypothetical protein
MRVCVPTILFMFCVLCASRLIGEGPTTSSQSGRWGSAESVFHHLYRSLRWEGADENVTRYLERGRVAFAFLKQKWADDHETTSVPDSYWESLETDGRALWALSHDRSGSGGENLRRQLTPSEFTLLGYIVEDLEVKADHCRKSAKGWAELVEVTVNTKKNGTPSANHTIWYCERGWANMTTHWLRFANVSTPTKAKLPPGVFLVRADATPSCPMTVGGDGKPVMQFDLEIQ